VPFAAVSDCLGLTAAAADPKTAEIAAMLRGGHRPAGGAFSAADAEFLVTEAILAPAAAAWSTSQVRIAVLPMPGSPEMSTILPRPAAAAAAAAASRSSSASRPTSAT